MTIVFPSSDAYFQQDDTPCHKAQIISNWFLEHHNEFTKLKLPPQSLDLNLILGCAGTGDSHHGFAAGRSAETVFSANL